MVAFYHKAMQEFRKVIFFLPKKFLPCLAFLTQYQIILSSSKADPTPLYSRAGEFTKKNLYHGKNRVFGPKNAPKKFGSPTPNFPPPQFGKQGCAQFIKVGTLRWSHRTQRIWIYVKVTHKFLIFSLFTSSLLNKFLTLLVNFQSKMRIHANY